MKKLLHIKKADVDRLLYSNDFDRALTIIFETYGIIGDMQIGLYKELKYATHRYREEIAISCFSEINNSKLMWAHYANSYSGFCIEYDFCGAKGDVLNQAFLLPVIYSEKRPSVPWKAALVDTDENRIEARMQMTKALLTKDAVWEYENEWRILLKSDSANLKMPNVTCIYLGKAISEENRNRILEIARENNIPVKQMWTDRGSYELHAVEI